MFSDKDRFLIVPAIIGIVIMFALIVQSMATIFFPDSWQNTMGDLLLAFAVIFGCLFVAATWTEVLWTHLRQSIHRPNVTVLDANERMYSVGQAVVRMPPVGESTQYVTLHEKADSQIRIAGTDVEWKHYAPQFPEPITMGQDEFKELQRLFGARNGDLGQKGEM